MDYEALRNLIAELGVMPGIGDTGTGRDWQIMHSPAQLAAFLVAMQAEHVQTVLELGTGIHSGTARLMHEALGWQVTTVNDVEPYTRGAGVEHIIATTRAAYPALAARQFDLVIIDASHEYADVKWDHEQYAPLARIVALHDILPGRACCEGVARYWREIAYTNKGKLRYGYHEVTANEQHIGMGYYSRAIEEAVG